MCVPFSLCCWVPSLADTSSIFENVNVAIPSDMSVEFAVGAKGPTRREIQVREHRMKSFLNLLIPVSRI